MTGMAAMTVLVVVEMTERLLESSISHIHLGDGRDHKVALIGNGTHINSSDHRIGIRVNDRDIIRDNDWGHRGGGSLIS